MKSSSMLLVLGVLGFVAAVLWPATNFLSVNFQQLSVGAYGRPLELLYLSLGAVAAGIGAAAIVGRFRSEWGLRLLTLFSAGVFLLFISATTRTVLRATGVVPAPTLSTILLISGALVALWFLSRLEAVRVLVSSASIFAFLVPASSLSIALAAAFFSGQGGIVAGQPANGKAMSGENVYYVVLDEYAGRSSLGRLGFDNAAFIVGMQALGFSEVPETRSNYMATYISLSAILDANYPVTEESPRYADRSAFYPAAMNAGIAPFAVRSFSASGYRNLRIGNWWAGCQETVFDACFEPSASNRNYALDTFLQPTILPRFISRIRQWIPADSDRPDGALEILGEVLDQIQAYRPYFLFVHHMAPHAPFSRHADCSPREALDTDETLPNEVRQALYLAATECVNHQVMETAKAIVARDPSAIIVVQSDHGSDFQVDWTVAPGDWTPEAIDERTDILNLVRLPADCQVWQRSGIGQINTMRLVLACLYRDPPEYLPEQSFVTVYEPNAAFGTAVRVLP